MPSFFIMFQHIAPQHFFSRVVGWAAQSKLLKKPFIHWFKNRYKVDLSEALVEDVNEFEHFNAFFTRALKPGVRPVCDKPSSVVSPADGVISQIGSIENHALLQAKGKHFSISSLLACDNETANQFTSGNFATIYLSPRDYHRVHMPLAGHLVKTTYVPGDLFSVNQQTTESVTGLFARNERLVCYFDTAAGPMALVLVGAMIVAGIETVWSGPITPNKRRSCIHRNDFDSVFLRTGQEMGRFKLGSTAIVLFQKGAVDFQTDAIAGKQVRMGERIATHYKPETKK